MSNLYLKNALILYILEYYSYLCRPIYIVLLWESLINIRLN